MPLLRIQTYPGMRQIFIASEEISHLATIQYSAVGSRYVKPGLNAEQEKVVGVAYGALSGSVSGQIIRAVTHGIVSGVVCAIAVNAGDRVAIASGGKIAPLNTVTPAGVISGKVSSGNLFLSGFSGGEISGYATATPINLSRVLGKALASGAANAGIPLLVTLGG